MEKPKIRFLKNKHSWVRNTFEEIAKRRTKSSDNPDLPRIEYQDIISGEGRLNKDLNKNIDYRKGIVFETNDILYGKLRPYLKNWLHPNFNGIALGDFWVLQARNCDSKFLFSLVQSPKFQRVANDTSGTKMPRSDWKTVSQTEFSIPTSNEEQSAIGKLFRTLDDLLSSYKNNLASYQSLKATMLSKMFPKAGQTVPEIRLDEFEGDWEKVKLKDVTESIEYGLNASAKEFDGENKYIRITDIDDVSRKFKEDSLTSPDINVSECDNYLLCEKDILFARTGASVGKTYLYDKKDGKVYFAGFLIRARIKEKFDSKFIFQNTLTDRFTQYVKVTSQRSGQPGVNGKEYGEYELYVPKYEEQQSIGSYFSNLNNLINSYQEKVSQLETLKKKLLQDMFI